MPVSAAASMPSRNGKNASDAITEPLTSSPSSAALIAAILVLYTRLIWPAPTPMVMLSLQKMIAFDLTYFTTVHANNMSWICPGVGAFSVTTLRSSAVMRPMSVFCTNSPPETFLKSKPLTDSPRSPVLSTRTFFFSASTAAASSSMIGATMTSTNWRSIIALAAAASSGRLKAIIPPKADVGSVWKALS